MVKQQKQDHSFCPPNQKKKTQLHSSVSNPEKECFPVIAIEFHALSCLE